MAMGAMGAMVLCTHRTMLSTPAQAVAPPGAGVGAGVGAMVLCTHRTMLSPLAINVVLPVAPAPLAAAMAKITKSPNPTLADWQKLVESKPKGIDFKSLCPIGPGNFIMSLCQDLQGRIYAGTEGDGLWSFDPSLPLADQWRHFTRANTGGPPEPNGAAIDPGNFLGDDYIYALTCDKLGRIWAGTLNHGVSVYNGQSGTGVPPVSGWKNYNILEGPLGERIFAITTSPVDDSVWMATSAGLARYSLKEDTWSYFTRTEGLSSDQANTLAFTKDGTLFVGTQCDGICIADAKDDYKTWRAVHAPKAYQDRVPLVPKGDGLSRAKNSSTLEIRRRGHVLYPGPWVVHFRSFCARRPAAAH